LGVTQILRGGKKTSRITEKRGSAPGDSNVSGKGDKHKEKAWFRRRKEGAAESSISKPERKTSRKVTVGSKKNEGSPRFSELGNVE